MHIVIEGPDLKEVKFKEHSGGGGGGGGALAGNPWAPLPLYETLNYLLYVQVAGIVLTVRYRNLKDPNAKPGDFL